MKLTDLLVSAIIKKGLLYEARNVDTEIIIPLDAMKASDEVPPLIDEIRIRFKCENMTLRIEKD